MISGRTPVATPADFLAAHAPPVAGPSCLPPSPVVSPPQKRAKTVAPSAEQRLAQTAARPAAAGRAVPYRKPPARASLSEEGAAPLDLQCEFSAVAETVVGSDELRAATGQQAGAGPGSAAAAAAVPVMRHRLREHLPAWREWTGNSYALEWVEEGFSFRWKNGFAPPRYRATNHASATDNPEVVDAAVAKLLASKAIEPVAEQPHVVCPIGVVEQNGKHRLIWDGRYTNEHLFFPSFKYEDLKVLPDWMERGDYMFTLDLSSGYHHVDVQEQFWTFMGFEWRGRFYVFTQLPFGLAPACWAFTKLMREVLRPWRASGVRCTGYLDDSWFGGPDEAAMIARRAEVVEQLGRLGFVVNAAKGSDVAQRVPYLGMEVDSVAGRMFVPAQKRERLFELLRSLQQGHRRAAVRAVASAKGQLLAMSWALGPAARLFTRALGRDIERRRSWSSHIALSPASRDELAFWLRSFSEFDGCRPIWRCPAAVSIYCDAAGKSAGALGGWGAWTVTGSGLAEARGNWGQRVSAMGSTPQELRAALCALQSFTGPAGLVGSTVTVLTDNQNAANIINKGSAKADNSYDAACEIFWYCIAHGIQLRAQWIPREQNQHADHLSKVHDSDDWMLKPQHFDMLSRKWGAFDIDLFASHTNHQVSRYYSAYLTPDTAGVDAFRFKWGRACWANPPFGIIARVLRHARLCEARLCLVVPYWPTQPWWRVLTPDGRRFSPVVRACHVFSPAPDLFLPGSTGNELPKRATAWAVLALLLDFNPRICGTAAAHGRALAVPPDPVTARMVARRPCRG